jgi:hypothetical protein
VLLEAVPKKDAPGGWNIRYGYQSKTPNRVTRTAETTPLSDGTGPGLTFSIPIQQSQRPGLIGALRIEARPWA